MNSTDQKKIISLLADEFEVDSSTISPDSSLMEALGLDSLDMVDVAVLIEKNCGVVLTQEELKSIVTFADFFRILDSKTK